jgi:hypothetical protein
LLLHPAVEDRRFKRILVAVNPQPTPDVLDELRLREKARPEEQGLNLKLMNVAMGLAEDVIAEMARAHDVDLILMGTVVCTGELG